LAQAALPHVQNSTSAPANGRASPHVPRLPVRMLNVAAAFSGGLWVQHKLNDIALPRISRAVDDGETFKLSVKVLSASIPGLAEPGLLTRERPRIEVVLGGGRKETEFGDFRPDGAWARVSNKSVAGAANDDTRCSWSFGDTLTFVATRADVLGPGLQVWVRTQSEVLLGPFQVSISRPSDVGMCSVDIRRLVLPSCSPMPGADVGTAGGGAPSVWESQPLLLPLTYIGGSAPPPSERNFVLGESAGHVALSFSVNAPPGALLREAEEATKPFVSRMANPLKEWTVKTAEAAAAPVRWVMAATEASCRNGDSWDRPAPCVQGQPARWEPSQLCGSFKAPRVISVDVPPTIVTTSPGLVGPELSPDEWVSHTSPRNGRTFWHHTSLGPAPWTPPRGRSLGDAAIARLPPRTVSLGDTRLSFGLGVAPSPPAKAAASAAASAPSPSSPSTPLRPLRREPTDVGEGTPLRRGGGSVHPVHSAGDGDGGARGVFGFVGTAPAGPSAPTPAAAAGGAGTARQQAPVALAAAQPALGRPASVRLAPAAALVSRAVVVPGLPSRGSFQEVVRVGPVMARPGSQVFVAPRSGVMGPQAGSFLMAS